MESDEQEHITSRAGLRLSQEFLLNLHEELGKCTGSEGDSAEKDVDHLKSASLSLLEQNVQDFNGVLTRKLEIENRVFNIRHELQYLVSEFIVQSEKRGIPIETSLSPNLPMRLKGDPIRFAQIVRTMLTQILNTAKGTVVLLEVQFLREYESAGELFVTVRKAKNKTGINLFGEPTSPEPPRSLALTVAKGLAELMDGDIEMILSPSNDYQFRFNARLEIVDNSGQLDFHKGRFSGKRLLLVNTNPVIVDIKRQELDALGFTITTETQIKRIIPTLQAQVRSGNAVENMLIYHEPNNKSLDLFLDEILELDDLKSVNKIIAASPEYQKPLSKRGFNLDNGYYFVSKPVGLFELESAFDLIYSIKGDDNELGKCKNGNILFFGDEEANQALVEECKKLPGNEVVIADFTDLDALLSDKSNNLAVIPCDVVNEIDDSIMLLREAEAAIDNGEGAFMPIVGVGKNCSERDIAAFEVGLDDYIDVTTESKNLVSTLRYWRSLEL